MGARRYVISGDVQAVGFRAFVQFEARTLGLLGWVRNTADGCVEVLACGEPSRLQSLEQKLRQGPELAVVERVQSFAAKPPATPGFFVLPSGF